MKKRVIRFYSVLFVIIFLLSSLMTVSAEQSNAKKEYLLNSTADVLPLLINEKNSLGTEYYLDTMISAYRISSNVLTICDYEIYPLFADNTIIAFVQLSQNNDGAYILCTSTCFADELQIYCENNSEESICLLYAYEGVYILGSASEPKCIYSTINEELSSIHSETIDWESTNRTRITPTEKIPLREIDFNAHQNGINGTRAVQYMILSVPFEGNASSSCSNPNCNGRGLCWAASIAMIVNYYQGTSYSAQGVHDATGCYSTGTASNYKSALNTFGVYTYGPYYTFTYTTIQNIVQGYHPAFMRIKLNSTSGHVIVPYGYYYNPEVSSTKYFYYMDPNYGGGIASFPSSGNLQITTSGSTYTFDYYIGTAW